MRADLGELIELGRSRGSPAGPASEVLIDLRGKTRQSKDSMHERRDRTQGEREIGENQL